jgi:hypothetical protein
MLGGLGAAVADGSKVAGVMLTAKTWPWSDRAQRLPLVVALAVRSGCAASLGGVTAAEGVVGWSDRPLALFLIGLAAPTVVQNGARIGRVVVRAIMGEYFGSVGGGDA